MLFLISGGRPVSFAIVLVMVGWLICLSACGFAADGLEIEGEGDNVTAGAGWRRSWLFQRETNEGS
jgi:hypothetical protein